MSSNMVYGPWFINATMTDCAASPLLHIASPIEHSILQYFNIDPEIGKNKNHMLLYACV